MQYALLAIQGPDFTDYGSPFSHSRQHSDPRVAGIRRL
jgi:hypothetical protein